MSINLNENLINMSEGYLFVEIARRVAAHREKTGAHGAREVISLGIGDVTIPLSPTVSRALAECGEALGTPDGFSRLGGYGDHRGELPLRSAIAERYRAERGISLCESEIFITDGAKSTLSRLLDLFGDTEIIVPLPAYPVYADASHILGKRVHAFSSPSLLLGEALPPPDAELAAKLYKKSAVIFLCSPNNPTGACFTRESLDAWVDLAAATGSIIIFDAAYEAYVTDPDAPHSPYESKNARKCAIEVCSFSKYAGFTGLRCGWAVIPDEILDSKLNRAYSRVQSTLTGGASRLAQVGALAALSEVGKKECQKSIDSYMQNARELKKFLNERGVPHVGGKNAPYLWVKCPSGMSSWQFFDYLLEKCSLVCTPGVGFGGAPSDGFVRFSSFAPRESVTEAIARLGSVF